MVVEGRNLLALGSTGLALEAFRKAVREQPDNIEAIAGIAECYEHMGRYDVAAQKYQAALAIAPNNVALLNTFAASLERQGLRAEAAELRAEAAHADAPAIAELTRGAAPTVVPFSPRTVAIQAPAGAPVAAVQSARVAPVEFAPSPFELPFAELNVSSRAPAISGLQVPNTPAVVTEVEVQTGARALQVEAPKRAGVAEVAVATRPIAKPEHRQSTGVTEWTFELPKANTLHNVSAIRDALPADAIVAKRETPHATSVTVTLPPLSDSIPARPAVKAPLEATVERAAQPRLERLSLGEVALLTSAGPTWTPRVVAENRQSVTVRFVPLRTASVSPNVRVLNAARQQGLAAMHRAVLLNRGWRRIAIGDAPSIRGESVVLYPADRRLLGRSLAAQFGFRSVVSNEAQELVVVLGRDAWTGRARRPTA